jgi:hypothetical protein
MPTSSVPTLTIGIFALLCCGCGCGHQAASNNATAQGTIAADVEENIFPYEGLPHQELEKELLAQERQQKRVQDVNGFPFYEQRPELHPDDAQRLIELLKASTTYLGPAQGKFCGGFHPDYAVEWNTKEGTQRILLCFGCEEAKVYVAEQATK